MATTLAELLRDVRPLEADGLDLRVEGIAYRSDKVRPGDVFFCVPGFVHDGHEFAHDAVARGAVGLVVTRRLQGLDVPQVLVRDTRPALAAASSVLFGDPSGRLSVVGVTGTNGKTTSAYLIDSIARAAGRLTGLLGTVETRIGDEHKPAARTTPESYDLQAQLAEMVVRGVTTVAMEVSSHAIDLHRVDAVRFDVAAFTNLSQDHLDYHKTLQEYFSVKRRLFTEMDVRERVVNIDDEYGAALAEETGARWTVGLSAGAAIGARDVVHASGSSRFTLVTPVGSTDVRLPLAGGFNVSNALVAAACALASGMTLVEVERGLAAAPQVPGRMEAIDTGDRGFRVFVDYAHTPDGLAKALGAVREVTPGRVIAVFGCGGDRDPEKRPLMGRAAGAAANHSVVTSDNPRSEDPVGIILQIEDGLKSCGGSYEIEVDRRRAISTALAQAREGDAVLIAGKGHEDYQIFQDRTVHFDDREVAAEELMQRC